MGKFSACSPAPYRFCWNCTNALYAGGRSYRIVRVAAGYRVWVHADCVTDVLSEHGGDLVAAELDQ